MLAASIFIFHLLSFLTEIANSVSVQSALELTKTIIYIYINIYLFYISMYLWDISMYVYILYERFDYDALLPAHAEICTSHAWRDISDMCSHSALPPSLASNSPSPTLPCFPPFSLTPPLTTFLPHGVTSGAAGAQVVQVVIVLV